MITIFILGTQRTETEDDLGAEFEIHGTRPGHEERPCLHATLKLTNLCNIAFAPSWESNHDHTYFCVFNLDPNTIVSSGRHGNSDLTSNLAPAHDGGQRNEYPGIR